MARFYCRICGEGVGAEGMVHGACLGDAPMQHVTAQLVPPPLTILEEAGLLVNGDRQADYGHPLDDYSRTAALWSAILGFPVTAEKAILCMVAMKLSRECHKHKRDNLVDAAGYLACAEKVIAERERRVSLCG